MVEFLLPKQVVAGSNPVARSIQATNRKAVPQGAAFRAPVLLSPACLHLQSNVQLYSAPHSWPPSQRANARYRCWGQVSNPSSSGLVAVTFHEDDHTYRREENTADHEGDVMVNERSYESNNNTSQSQTYA